MVQIRPIVESNLRSLNVSTLPEFGGLESTSKEMFHHFRSALHENKSDYEKCQILTENFVGNLVQVMKASHSSTGFAVIRTLTFRTVYDLFTQSPSP